MGAAIGMSQLAWARASAGECANALQNKLQLLHSSDNESSFVDPNTLEEKILNYGGVVRGLRMLARRECLPSVHLTAGDHTLPGPFYEAAAEVPRFGEPGLGDIALYNAMGLRANGMGNHEFDGGINEFAHMLTTANYPFIAVNLDFNEVVLEPDTPRIEIGPDGEHCALSRGKVVKSCFIFTGGHKLGLIGRAPADFFNVIENPEETLPGLDFVGGRDPETNQPLVSAVDQVLEQVDLLASNGVERIILLDHAQDFTADPLSASSLRGIDIIVAAGSTGFMAQSEPMGPFNLLREGDTPQADYPVMREDGEGETVLVVNSDQLYRYVGHLVVEFDDEGHIAAVDPRSGPVATIEQAVERLAEEINPRLRTLQAPARVRRVLADLQATPTIQDAFTVIGMTASPLNGERAEVRSRETNLSRLVADSTLAGARRFASANGLPAIDIALKNGGGIRDSILGPNIIRLTIQAALAFNNQLAVVELTGAQLLAAMENGVSRVPAFDGRFPHLANVVLEYDAEKPGIEGAASLTEPSRVQTLIVTRADGGIVTLVENSAVIGDLSLTFVMATNSFLATGGDGYRSLEEAISLGVTEIGEQQILEDFIQTDLGGFVDLADPPSDPRVVRLAP